jgi:hypothetical protein
MSINGFPPSLRGTAVLAAEKDVTGVQFDRERQASEQILGHSQEKIIASD